MDAVLSAMSEQANPKVPMVSRKNNGFSRNDVVQAFQAAFEIIGGTSRLSLWANANPDKFYPLYAKLMPSTTVLLGDAGALEIIHRIAPTALDDHTHADNDVKYEYQDIESREIKEETVSVCLPSSLPTSPEVTSAPFTREADDGPSSWPTDEQGRPSPL